MSWDKMNLYNLIHKQKLPDFTRKSVFQQKWIAKRELRAYHVPNISEKQLLDRHWNSKLPLRTMTKNEEKNMAPIQALTFAELERRLDVVVFRSHFASSIFMARRLVVNGKVKCVFPARRLEDGDMVTMNPKYIPMLRNRDSKKAETEAVSDQSANEVDSNSQDSNELNQEEQSLGHPEALKFNQVEYMSPWMFIPAYLEVCYNTTSTVFLRSPLPATDGTMEIPSPHPPELHALTYEWYSSKKRVKTKIFDKNEGYVIRGQRLRLKKRIIRLLKAKEEKIKEGQFLHSMKMEQQRTRQKE